ncbi:protein of unknown function [Taphrina deformans PYCC 5710]|uniref:C3H1-type domain-containing protein n=1 Tax=Taphrina deformans (strain PYCC 5710 / ATCC 11124 / CBS 356.35 / IMI 108563 / JCM 9778 / NBRC 8474) TaxID=1097556 RepID=R4XA06_TAPDE|nr:protein of unknown function [Taphrina deformans PYCC 5710]|eukprot:CCG81094.1 protein of unknown function [Taphrina deformans PYCC 5710]
MRNPTISLEVSVVLSKASAQTTKIRATRVKEPSAHIIPAARFPQNAQEKEHLTKGFYAEKKRILCRDFEASLNSIEGYYCPRFNDCLYAHLKASISPNSQVRNEPFTFTPERIKQLRMRRRQEQGHTAEFLRFLRSSPAHFPLFVTERIERLLQTLIIDLTAAQAEPIARALVGEFHDNFGSALIDLRGYAHPRARSLAEARLQNTPTDHFDALVHIIREYDADGVLMLMTQRDAEWSNSNLPENLQEWRMPTLQIEQDEQIIYHYVTTRGTFINTSEHHNDHLDLMRDLGRKNNEQGDVGSNSSADLHMYHIFHDDGSRPEMRAAIPASIFEEFPTHVEFIEPIKMNFAGLDSLTHHFMSPCSVEEARAIFLLSPGYLATRAALDANQAGMQHLDEVGERTILAFERGGNNSSRNRLPNGLPFLPMGVPRDNIFDELDEDDYDFHEYYESDENPWNAYMAGAHGLESALYDDEDVDDDNDDDDDEDNESGDDEDADGISSDEESDDDMPGIVPVESDDGDTWGTVSERSARTDSDGEDMLCHATVDGDSSGAEGESRFDRAVLSTASFQHDTSGQEDSMEEDNVGDASTMPSVD